MAAIQYVTCHGGKESGKREKNRIHMANCIIFTCSINSIFKIDRYLFDETKTIFMYE